MAREGLMDDCGYDFPEWGIDEETAYNEGYEAGKADMLKEIKELVKKSRGHLFNVEDEYYIGVKDGYNDILEQIEELKEQKE